MSKPWDNEPTPQKGLSFRERLIVAAVQGFCANTHISQGKVNDPLAAIAKLAKEVEKNERRTHGAIYGN